VQISKKNHINVTSLDDIQEVSRLQIILSNYLTNLLLISALPLVVGITPSECEDALTKLYSLIQRILPANAFFNRGPTVGPQLFMTDDSASEQLALNNVWPM